MREDLAEVGRVGVGPVYEGARHNSSSGPPAQAVLLCPGDTSVAAAAGGALGGSPPFLTGKVATLAASPCLELVSTRESQAFSGGVLAVGVLRGAWARLCSVGEIRSTWYCRLLWPRAQVPRLSRGETRREGS